MISQLKSFIQNNSWLFFLFRFIPYRFRLGKTYIKHSKLLVEYDDYSYEEKEEFHYSHIKRLINFAYENIEFYKWFYDRNFYHPSSFKKLSDFNDVPIVTKADLKLFEFDKRSQPKNSPFRVNTGGTSGQPLNFFLDKKAFAREWAYMHNIWSTLGYSYLDTKLTFRGKTNNGKPLRFNVIHNEYIVDAYVSFDLIISELKLISKNRIFKYIHGYPSSIYEFCKHLKCNNIDPCDIFGNHLKGVFLGSEYPALKYRDLIEDVLNVPTISWYGHSEMAILAYEKVKPFTYHPFQTYGFTESVKSSSGDSRLIGTSYYNFNSPFIRYDTGDIICDEQYQFGILESFKISSGRVGDFIYDKNDNSISLTALIFGRHHNAFNKIDFLQVKQYEKGYATLLVTSSTPVSLEMFDLENIEMDFEIEITNAPFKTSAGKVPLLIS